MRKPDIAKWVSRLPAPLARPLGRIVRSDLAQKSAETFLNRIFLILIGLATSVLIARAVGPEGRGMIAAIGAITALGSHFTNLGLYASNTYYVAREPDSLGTLVGNSILVSLGFGSVIVVLAGTLFLLFPNLVGIHGIYLALALAGIPLSVLLLLLRNLLIGMYKVRRYNNSELVSKIANTAILAAMIVAGLISVLNLVILSLIVMTLQCIWTGWNLMHGHDLRIRPSLKVLWSHMPYGFKAYLSSLFAFGVVRIDVLLCSSILGSDLTGQYYTAVSMTDLIYMLAATVSAIALPRLVAIKDRDERWEKSRDIAKWVGVAMILTSLAAAVLARPLVLLLYGKAFLPAVPAFYWLLPGICMLGVNSVFQRTFSSDGMPWISVWSPGVGAVVDIGLNFLLLPRIGLLGAPIASTVAYGLMLTQSLVYMRLTGRWRRRTPAPEIV